MHKCATASLNTQTLLTIKDKVARSTMTTTEENAYELVNVPNMLSSATNKSDSRVNLTMPASRNRSELNQRKPQSAGKMCAMILVALIAAFAILVLAGIVALILFNPETRESNSEIETLKQQVETLRQQNENLRIRMSQIEQRNASLLEGTSGEEILQQNIQEKIIQELQLQMNRSIQDLGMKVNIAEQKIENILGNQSTAEITEILIHEMRENMSRIQFHLEALSENVSESFKALKEEVQENNTAVQLEIENLKTMLEETTSLNELRSKINMTEIHLEKLSNVTASITETFSLDLSKTQSQINRTRIKLSNQITTETEMLTEVVNQQLSKVGTHINQTQSNVEQINLVLLEALENRTAPLAIEISYLRDQTNNSLETLKLQFTNTVHDLELQLDHLQNNNGTGSEFNTDQN